MIRLTIITLAGLVGLLMAFDDPAHQSGHTETSGVDTVVLSAPERVTLRRISQPASPSESAPESDRAPARIVQATATAAPVAPLTASVQGTVVHQTSIRQALPAMIRIVSHDAPTDARAGPTPSANTPPAAAPQTGDSAHWFVSGSRVNLRAGPSTTNQIVTSLTRDTAVELIGTEGTWAHLRVVATGAEGFMAQRFLRR